MIFAAYLQAFPKQQKWYTGFPVYHFIMEKQANPPLGGLHKENAG